MKKEDQKLQEIDRRLYELRSNLESIFPVWNVADRRIKNLQLEIKSLENERIDLKEGQLSFDDKF